MGLNALLQLFVCQPITVLFETAQVRSRFSFTKGNVREFSNQDYVECMVNPRIFPIQSTTNQCLSREYMMSI